MTGMSGMSGMGSMGHGAGGGGGGGGAISLLPAGMAVAWMVVFVAILIAHARHAANSDGERRLWHVGHVLMAGSMALMYAPASVDPVHVAPIVWQIVFCLAALGSAAGLATRVRARSVVGLLWLALALDLAAMIYMWRPDRSLASLGWLLFGYFCVQAVLWAGRLRRGGQFGRLMLAGPGAGAAALLSGRGARTVCLSMCVMTLGMAYMLVAMQVS